VPRDPVDQTSQSENTERERGDGRDNDAGHLPSPT
jgi:hypothetical protein